MYSHRMLSLIFLAVLTMLIPDAAFAAPGEVSIMSFNIRYGTANDGANHWEKRHELVYDVIRKHDCDAVGLQEALHFQIEQICDAVPHHGIIGVGRDDGKTKGEYSAIMYRTDRLNVADSGTFWLSDTPDVAGSITWGNACTRVCTWARFVQKKSGKAFYLFNVHLDHRSQSSREKSMVLLARRIRDRKHPDPVIVTGDFNAGESNPAIRYLRGELNGNTDDARLAKNPIPLVDTFRLLHPEATEAGTFNGFKGERSGGKIDYVFALPGAKVLEAAILHDNAKGRYPSDHFPVMARFALTD